MKKLFYLLAILLFPSIAYVLFSLGEHHVERLGYYGVQSVNANGDTIYDPVSWPELWTGIENLDTRQLNGRVVIVHFLRIPCDESCKTQLTTLSNYLSRIKVGDRWMILSIGLGQAISAEDLSGIQSKIVYGEVPWVFTRSHSSEEFQRRLVSFSGQDLRDALVLIDQNGRIRAYFDTRFYQENKKLEDAVKLLIQEPHLSWKTKKK